MRNAVIRLYRTVHSWTGIVCGLLLFVAFYAGAITMFAEPLARWAEPPRLSIPLADAPRLIDHVLATRPESREEMILYLGDSHAESRLFWYDPKKGETYAAYRDAAGRLAVGQPTISYLPRALDLIHRAGGIPGDRDLSLHIMGLVSLLYFVAIFSGLVLVLRSFRRDVFALRVGRSLKRMWLDAHNAVGVIGLPFHVFIAVTSVGFAFDSDIYTLQERFVYEGQAAASGSPFDAVDLSGQHAAMLPPAELVARVRAIAPGFVGEYITYLDAGDANAVAVVSGRNARHLSGAASDVRVGAVRGEILDASELPGRGSAWHASATTIAALHFGRFGGEPVRWGYFLLGLSGAFLFYSGNLLWIESRWRRPGPNGRSRRSIRLMASATIGVAFGCIAGVSLSIAAAKWLHGQVADLASWHVGIFYFIFSAGVIWAFAAGVSRALPGLMRAAALATATIPLASLAAALFPSLGLWNNPGAPLGVDLVAAAGAGALAWGGSMTSRRIGRARPDSIWHSRLPRARPVKLAP